MAVVGKVRKVEEVKPEPGEVPNDHPMLKCFPAIIGKGIKFRLERVTFRERFDFETDGTFGDNVIDAVVSVLDPKKPKPARRQFWRRTRFVTTRWAVEAASKLRVDCEDEIPEGLVLPVDFELLGFGTKECEEAERAWNAFMATLIENAEHDTTERVLELIDSGIEAEAAAAAKD